MRSLFLSSLVLLAGCSPQEMVERLVPPEDRVLATRYIDLLRSRSFEEIELAFDPSIAGPRLRETLTAMANLLPAGNPTSTKIIGAQRFIDGAGTTTNITFEYEFSGEWVVVNVALLHKQDAVSIVGFNVYPMAGALEELNAFRLEGKSLLHYAVLGLVIALPIFTIYALVACFMTRMPGRKWAWALFILFGVGSVALNWTTGEWEFQPLRLQLLSASATAALYQPWVLSASFPLGAVIFLFRRRRLREPVTEPQQA